MTTSGVTSTLGSQGSSAAQNAANSAAQSQQQLATNMNTFLTLLTAQLQHQDPLNPTDTSQFTNQLVLFAQVQQQIDINQNLTTMMGSQNNAALAASANYLGTGVTAVSPALPLQDSKSTFYYTTPANTASVSIVMTDAAGNIVETQKGVATAGTQTATWDGSNISGGTSPRRHLQADGDRDRHRRQHDDARHRHQRDGDRRRRRSDQQRADGHAG